jgi:hypothetical protein
MNLNDIKEKKMFNTLVSKKFDTLKVLELSIIEMLYLSTKIIENKNNLK